MLLFGGAAAVGAMREIIVQAKHASFQRAAERAMRGRIRLTGSGTEAWEDPVEEEDFVCFRLCLNCGYLSDSDGGLCPGCGVQNWVDLRDKQSAEAIRTMERRDRRMIPLRIQQNGRILGIVFGLAVGAATYGALVAADPEGSINLGLTGLATAAGLFAGIGLIPRIWNSLHFRRRRTFPARWHLPVPLPDLKHKPTTVLEGALSPKTTELLTSPVTGTPCLGYEVSVLFDAVADKRPPMWILEEEHNIGFELQGTHVEPDGATFELPAELVSNDDWAEDSTVVGRFLRMRGLFPSEGSYSVFEALLEPNMPYRVELYEHPENAAAVVRPG